MELSEHYFNQESNPPPSPLSALRPASRPPSIPFQLTSLQIRRTCPLRSRRWWSNCSSCPERRRARRQSFCAARRLSRKLMRGFAGQFLFLTNKQTQICCAALTCKDPPPRLQLLGPSDRISSVKLRNQQYLIPSLLHYQLKKFIFCF